MAEFKDCQSPSPLTGRIGPDLIEEVGGVSLAGVLAGTETLPVGAIPVTAPLYDSPSPTGTAIGLRLDSSLTVDAQGRLSIAGAPSPAAHASSHEPGGSDPITPAAFDGLITPPVATTVVLGGVKDGDGVSIAGDGTLTLDLAAASGLEISGGTLRLALGTGVSFSGNDLVLDEATDSTLGGIIAGTGLSVSSGTASLNAPQVTGASLAGSTLVWDTSPSAQSPSPALRLPASFTYTKAIPQSQLPTAAYGSPGSSSPSPQLGLVRIYGPSEGLTLSDGLLSLATPISTDHLPTATGLGGRGIVRAGLLDGTGVYVSNSTTGQLAILIDATSDTLALSSSGIKVKSNRFLALTGTGNLPSPAASPSPGTDGWMTGSVRFTNDLGEPAIRTGNQRIRYEFGASPSPGAILASADLSDLLTYQEISTLISQAELGVEVWTPGRPVQAEPGTSLGALAELSAGDRFLTSTSSNTNPGGDWNAHNCVFAVWTETAPDTFTWVYETPTVNTWFTDDVTGDTWAVVVGSPSPKSPSPNPSREAFRYRARQDDTASTARAGRVRVPTTSGLVMDGEDIRLSLASDIGVSTGLRLITRARNNALALDLSRSQGILELNSDGRLQVAASSIQATEIADNTIVLDNLAADQVTGGTKDFIATQYDGLSVRLVGDSEDFRVTGAPVSTATTILIHTEDGIGVAEESINTDALSDEAVSYSKLLMPTASGLEDNGQDKVRVKLQTRSGLERTVDGLAVNIHDVVDDATIELDTSTGGLRVKTGSLTSSYFASGLAISASVLTLGAPMLSSSGLLTFCYQSPLVLTGSPGCLTIGEGLISSPYLGTGSVSYAKLKLASPSGITQTAGGIKVDISTGLAFSGNQIVVDQVPADAMALDADSALYAASPTSPLTQLELSIRVSSPFTQTGGTLDLADEGVQVSHLDRSKLRGSFLASGLEAGLGTQTSPFDSWVTSPAFYTGSDAPGMRVATRTRSDHDYLDAAGQGQGTFEPYSLTLLQLGGTPSGSDYQNRLAPTLNSIGLPHLALGNETLAPTDSDRLPTGFGSYKALVQSGKLPTSPVTSRGWAVANLSENIPAVRVGPGLSITAAGFVVPSDVQADQILLGTTSRETSPRGVSSLALVRDGGLSSPVTDGALALGYDVSDFEVTSALGLGRRQAYQEEYTGASVPAAASGYYTFALTLGSSQGLVPGTVSVHVNGLRLESPFFSYTSPSITSKEVYLNESASPGPNLAYTLSQSTSPDVLDRVVIRYRTRPTS